MQNYGGNQVKSINIGEDKEVLLGKGPYLYTLYVLKAGESASTEGLPTATIFVKDIDENATIALSDSNKTLSFNDTAQVEKTTCTFTAQGGSAVVLVAGVTDTFTDSPYAQGITITRKSDHYKVVKPWGHELWLNQQHPGYAIKEIFLKKGNRCSLQYHDFKQETNILFSGTTKLVYKSNPGVDNMDVMDNDLGEVLLEPVSAIDVCPPILHRLEAMTDITLYEVSTPHLDDVVRVQDDSGRGQGRIQSEHQEKSA